METFQANWHWFEPHRGFSGTLNLALGNMEGCAVAFLGCSLCPRLCSPSYGNVCTVAQHLLVHVQHYQNDHHCVEPSCCVAQDWTLIKHFYDLLGPKLATPGGDKFPLPSQVYRLLGTKVDLTVSPRENSCPSLVSRFNLL